MFHSAHRLRYRLLDGNLGFLRAKDFAAFFDAGDDYVNEQLPSQLNDTVRHVLRPYENGLYTLTPKGQEIVTAANAGLDMDYAKAHFLPVADWTSRELSSALALMPPNQFETVLDVCAGTGFVSLSVMRKRLFKKCVAIDLNTQALKLLEERARKEGIEGIEIRSGNIMATGFASNTFDCIMGNSFLHHLPDNEKFLTEMHRILKPGGVICITGEPSPTNYYWANYFQRIILRMVGKKHGPRGPLTLTDIWEFSTDGLVKLLTSVGFAEVKIKGVGKRSESFLSLIDRAWVRYTGRSAPSAIWRFAYWLRYLESRGENSPDEMAILTITARK